MTDAAGITVGNEIAGYLVEELIGRGGMGEVYRAHDDRLDRNVALKILAPRFAEDETFRERLLRESRLAASLDHPNVVPVYDAGEADGRFYLVLRYVHGTDLKALLRNEGALDPARTIAIAAQVADALDTAHERGLVHRDVKPSNVLLDQQGGREHAYLADFGLMQSASSRGPSDGQLMGTADYVAPEQIRGDDVDGRADVYALGCLLFETLTGTVPFAAASDVAVVYAHLEQEPPRASERRPELPSPVDDVLARAMAKDRDSRQSTCRALVEDARTALGIAPSRPSHLWHAVAVVASIVAVVLAVAAAFALMGDDAASPTHAGKLIRIDPDANVVAVAVSVPGDPGNLVVTPGGIWIADFVAGVLWRYQPTSGGLQRITSYGEPRDLAAVGNDVYVGADGEFLSGIVSRYDSVTGIRRDGVELLACAMGAGGGVVWAAGCPFVQRLSTDDARLRIVKTIPIPFAEPSTAENARAQMRELAVGGGSLWVLGDALDRRLWRLDARTGRTLATIDLDFPPRSAAFGGGRLWISDSLNDTVVPVDARTNAVLDPIPVGRSPGGVAVGAGSVWVPNMVDATVTRIDLRTSKTTDTIPVEGFPREITFGGRAVWVTAYER